MSQSFGPESESKSDRPSGFVDAASIGWADGPFDSRHSDTTKSVFQVDQSIVTVGLSYCCLLGLQEGEDSQPQQPRYGYKHNR